MGKNKPRWHPKPEVLLTSQERTALTHAVRTGQSYAWIYMSVHRRTGCGLVKAKNYVDSQVKGIAE